MQCDIKAARCIGNAFDLLLTRLSVDRTKKVEESRKLFFSVFNMTTSRVRDKKFCPNHEFSCDEDQTCCPLDGGDYGCCPLGSDAVCCQDNEHCCPAMTTCNLEEGTCVPQPATKH